MEEGIIYILINRAMPNLVKIGMTARSEVRVRMRELYSTGVPVPFECVYAGKTSKIRKVENALHIAFAPYRLNASREFFSIEPEQAITILRLICDEEVTPDIIEDIDREITESDRQASKKLARRRPRYNFKEMGIPTNVELTSNYNSDSCICCG